jgi:hypothetical protein
MEITRQVQGNLHIVPNSHVGDPSRALPTSVSINRIESFLPTCLMVWLVAVDCIRLRVFFVVLLASRFGHPVNLKPGVGVMAFAGLVAPGGLATAGKEGSSDDG